MSSASLGLEKYDMKWPHKLKQASFILALGPALTILLILFVVWKSLGVEAAYTFVGFVFLAFAGISFLNYARHR